MLVNFNSSNEQLMSDETVRTALDSGNVILYDKRDTSNPDYVSMYFVGYCELQADNNNGVSDAQRMLLGWDKNTIFPMRCIQNASRKVADSFEIGTTFKDFAVRIVDANIPSYETQTPRQSKDGEVYTDADGNPIYRNVVLVTKSELSEKGHSIIRRAAVKKTAVTAEALLTTTV